MRWIAKQPIRIMMLTLLFATVATLALFSLKLTTDSSVLTTAISVWTTWLRNLSLSSTSGNLLAWGLLLLTSAGPLLLFFNSKFRSAVKIVMISALCLMIALSQYLLINPWLIITNINDSETEVLPMLIRIFLLVILSLGLIAVLYSLFATRDDEPTLITRFQWLLLITLFAYVTSMTVSAVSQWQSLTETSNVSILALLLLIELLPSVLMWTVVASVIRFLQIIKAGLFETSNLEALRKLKQLAHLSLTVSVSSLFAFNLLQMVVLSLIDGLHFRVHIPMIELMTLLIVLFLSMILEKSIPVYQENQTFV